MVSVVSETLEPKAVKLQVKTTKSEKYAQYFVTVPKEFVEALKLRVGDILKVEVKEVEVNGSKRKALVYYRV
jgi:bifunctional DNA-binding transcriptional regulator/antitoxin component of YhaV-PrlF toxin-antitoxin module